MRFFLICTLLALCLIYGRCAAQEAYISPEIKPYIEVIEQSDLSPLEYVMNLFERYDVVILGERDHRDTTQYDLIEQIISDPRFIEKVGHVMTECGSYNMTDEINEVLKASYADDSIFEERLLETYKNIDFMPLWDATNYHQYLYSVYRTNKTLSSDKKLTITLLDIPWSWRDIPKDIAQEDFDRLIAPWHEGLKDSIMGRNAIETLDKIFSGDQLRKKALIIFNFGHSGKIEDGNWESAGKIIFDAFPKRTTNVLLNWASRDGDEYVGLIQKGKWDAAFAACGNRSVGFDLSDTPFGRDTCDLTSSSYVTKYTYGEQFGGLIFYKPVQEWVLSAGVPTLDRDKSFIPELAWRFNLFMGTNFSPEEFELGMWRAYSKLRSFKSSYFIPHIEEQIQTYYKPGAEKGK